jgi:6-phosphogluconolactonase
LTPINQEPSGGAGACFVSVDPTGTYAFVANYTAGSVAVFPIRADGGINPASTLVRHSGSGAHATRQTRAHAHAIRMAPGGAFVLAADLGADRLFVYRFDARRGSLTANDPPAAVVPSGSGPRHFIWQASGDAMFVINELSSTIATYAWDGARGTLDPRGAVSTLPDFFTDENTTAEVTGHPSGRFVYGSNRGHDSIAAFGVADDGTLTRVGLYPARGKTPRHFSIDPSGEFLLAANQESDSLVLFRIDQQSGALIETTGHVTVPSPVFVCMPRMR